PAAARLPRALRHGAVPDPRLLPPDRAQRGRLRARAAGRAGADGAGQLRPGEADRADDAAPRARIGRGRARRRGGHARRDADTGAYALLTRLGVIFTADRPPEQLPAFAAAAESAGLDELWLWEDC